MPCSGVLGPIVQKTGPQKPLKAFGGLRRSCNRPRVLPGREVYFLTQEFGTYHAMRVLRALRAENRWHHYGDGTVDHPTKRELEEKFSPADEDWRQTVLRRGCEVIGQALTLAVGN